MDKASGEAMEGFVRELDSVDAVDLDPAHGSAHHGAAPHGRATQKARVGRSGPAHDDQTIKTFRGLAYGLPIAVGLWVAIIGVSAYLIA